MLHLSPREFCSSKIVIACIRRCETPCKMLAARSLVPASAFAFPSILCPRVDWTLLLDMDPLGKNLVIPHSDCGEPPLASTNEQRALRGGADGRLLGKRRALTAPDRERTSDARCNTDLICSGARAVRANPWPLICGLHTASWTCPKTPRTSPLLGNATTRHVRRMTLLTAS